MGLPNDVARLAPEVWWDEVQPLFEAGDHATAADALAHLRTAVAIYDGCAEMAKHDSDFDPLRGEPAFAEIVGG